MTTKQKETIQRLRFEISELRRKYKSKRKPIARKSKYYCFVCNKSYKSGFVCATCVYKDVGFLERKVDRLENSLHKRVEELKAVNEHIRRIYKRDLKKTLKEQEENKDE